MIAFPPVPFLEGKAVVLMRDNVDTDQIIPSREMRTTGKTGLSAGLFAGWRYLDPSARTPDPAFVLNGAISAEHRLLIAGANFGCGSSREHAVWALHEFGFRAVIASSLAPIFRANCIRNGIVPVVLEPEAIAALVLVAETGSTITVETASRRLTSGSLGFDFALDEEACAMLCEGLDAIGLTLKLAPRVEAFLDADRRARPWVYPTQDHKDQTP
jgi:3-isopropylmalate/(R)-2-methylmalate dehydratase small subunit